MKSRLSTRSRIAAMLLAVALAIGLFDPYSFGDEGGEFGLRSHTWQVAAAALQATMLIIASYAAYSSARRRAFSVATAESLLFLLLNVAYVLRDGLTRFEAGYTADTTVIVVFAIGVMARCTAIGLLLSSADANATEA